MRAEEAVVAAVAFPAADSKTMEAGKVAREGQAVRQVATVDEELMAVTVELERVAGAKHRAVTTAEKMEV